MRPLFAKEVFIRYGNSLCVSMRRFKAGMTLPEIKRTASCESLFFARSRMVSEGQDPSASALASSSPN